MHTPCAEELLERTGLVIPTRVYQAMVVAGAEPPVWKFPCTPVTWMTGLVTVVSSVQVWDKKVVVFETVTTMVMNSVVVTVLPSEAEAALLNRSSIWWSSAMNLLAAASPVGSTCTVHSKLVTAVTVAAQAICLFVTVTVTVGSEDDPVPVSLKRSNDEGDGKSDGAGLTTSIKTWLAASGQGESGLLEGSSDADGSSCLLIRNGCGVIVGAEPARLGVLRHMYTVMLSGTEAVVVSVK